MGYLELSEKELVQRAIAGDQMAYRALYQLHEKAIRGRVSGYFKWKADVDDVVSESFQKAFLNLGHFDTSRELRPWLSTSPPGPRSTTWPASSGRIRKRRGSNSRPARRRPRDRIRSPK